jgi:deazaflavin-dependent oxidoreductase (nitroreductase family)
LNACAVRIIGSTHSYTVTGVSAPRVLFAIPVALLAAGLVRRLRIAAGMRRGDQAVIDAKRERNKRFANKLVTRVGRAGRPHSIFAIVEVTGRRTGRRYTTPVRVVEQPTEFVVPLTYGPKTSWFVNLRHNPGVLRWQGHPIPVGNPVAVPTSTVARLLPPPSRFLLWLDGTDQCVLIQKLIAAERPSAGGDSDHSGQNLI